MDLSREFKDLILWIKNILRRVHKNEANTPEAEDGSKSVSFQVKARNSISHILCVQPFPFTTEHSLCISKYLLVNVSHHFQKVLISLFIFLDIHLPG